MYSIILDSAAADNDLPHRHVPSLITVLHRSDLSHVLNTQSHLVTNSLLSIHKVPVEHHW